MIKTLNIIILICSCIVTFYACQKHMLEVKGWVPEIITPLINATVTIGDLLPEKGTTEHDSITSLIHLRFSSDTIYVLPPDLLLDIAGLNIDTAVTLKQLFEELDGSGSFIVNILEEQGLDLTFPEGVEQPIEGSLFNFLNEDIIDSFTFPLDTQIDENTTLHANTQFKISVTNNLPVDIDDILITMTVADEELDFNISNISSEQNGAAEFTLLEDIEIGDVNEIEVDITNFSLTGPTGEDVLVDDETGLAISFSIDYIDLTLPLGRDTVDVDLALFEDFDSGLILENPQFTIIVDNPFELSGSINGYIDAFSQDGNSASLPIYVPIVKDSELSFHPNFDNITTYGPDSIKDIIELPPHILEYESVARMRFNSSQIEGSDPLKLGVDVDFPLSVDAANLSLKDTIPFNGIDYDITQIERMLLHYNLVNGFPLGTEFNLVLHDSLKPMENLDTLKFIGINDSNDNIIAAAEVNNDGEVIADVVTSGVLTLSYSEINNLLNANKIILDITLSSSDAEDFDDTYVKIYTYNKCVLKVGVETQINTD